MSFIREGLFLGDIRDAKNEVFLESNGITRVLSVGEEFCNKNKHFTFDEIIRNKPHKNGEEEKRAEGENEEKIHFYESVLFPQGEKEKAEFKVQGYAIAIEDIATTNLYRHFEPCLALLMHWHRSPLISNHHTTPTKAQHRVLVHCAAGISRSASIVIAYLMITENFGHLQAREEVKRCRSRAHPNQGFLKQLEFFDVKYSKFRSGHSQPSFVVDKASGRFMSTHDSREEAQLLAQLKEELGDQERIRKIREMKFKEQWGGGENTEKKKRRLLLAIIALLSLAFLIIYSLL